jgi:hypothetical protein
MGEPIGRAYTCGRILHFQFSPLIFQRLLIKLQNPSTTFWVEFVDAKRNCELKLLYLNLKSYYKQQ